MGLMNPCSGAWLNFVVQGTHRKHFAVRLSAICEPSKVLHR
jgi:hypothetical protein